MRTSAVLVSAVVLSLTALASAPPHPSTVAFEIEERDLLPESIAYDASERAFYVGSMYRRKIVRVDADGQVTDFVASKQDGLWTVLGLKIDQQRRELWAASCNLGPDQRPPMIDAEPETAGHAAVHRYDLRTGELVRRYQPADPPPSLCFNDLVQTVDGDVYLSSGPTGVWRIRSGADTVEPFTEADGRFGNGIAASADGRTLYLAVHDQGIVAIDVATRTMATLPAPDEPHVKGIDGLYLHEGALVGIQNGTKSPRVVRAYLAADGASIEHVEVLEQDHPRFDVPTTGVIVDDALYYVATSQLDDIDPQTNAIAFEALQPNVILKLPLHAATAPGSAAPAPVSAKAPAGGCAGRRF